MASKKKTPRRASKPKQKTSARRQRAAASRSSKTARRPAPKRRPKAAVAPRTRPQRAAAPRPAAPVPKAPATPPDAGRKMARSPLSRKDLEMFRQMLLNLRDRIVDGISFLAGDNLNKSQRDASGDLSNHAVHMADQGTDNFDREFALSLVSNEQEVLYEIDEALHRIDAGTYGICEMTGRPIEIERLKVLPYARYCREAQEQLERNRKRFRPFTSSGIPGEAFGSQDN